VNAFAEFFANAHAASRLKPKFYWMTTAVGALVCATGLGVLVLVSGLVESLLGIDLDASIRESRHASLWGWLFIVAIPFAVWAAMPPVAWACGHLMARMGYMEKSDIKYYALRSRYPAHWFKDGQNKPPSA
jgi:hypothetical protein